MSEETELEEQEDEEEQEAEQEDEPSQTGAASQAVQEPAPAAAVAQEAPPKQPRFHKLDFVGPRNWYFAFSLLIIIPGLFFMATRGFLLGIDFAGGTEFTIYFTHPTTTAQVERAVAQEPYTAAVQTTSDGGYIVRTPPLQPVTQKQFVDDLSARVAPVDQTKLAVNLVTGTIAGETIEFALLAIVLASVFILGLLALRFRDARGGWRAGFQFGGVAIIKLLHDVFLMTGIFSILGRVFDLRIGQIDALFVTAVLTVVGFSVHDTIVVFDRIRENSRVSSRLNFDQIVNLSIIQTLDRSIITSFTVVLVLVAILFAGGETLQGFALALLIGIVSGTYSSIFNAAPLLVVWRRLQPIR